MKVQNLKIDFILASIKFLAQKVVPVYYNLNSVFQTNEMKRIILSIHCCLRRYDIKSHQQRKIKFSIFDFTTWISNIALTLYKNLGKENIMEKKKKSKRS